MRAAPVAGGQIALAERLLVGLPLLGAPGSTGPEAVSGSSFLALVGA
ncbi:hypothetical protein [Streptomyces sannanensis]